jgi:hypothetical protein
MTSDSLLCAGVLEVASETVCVGSGAVSICGASVLLVVACAFARTFEPFGLNKMASLCEFLTCAKAVCASLSVLYGPTITTVLPPDRIARAGRPSLRRLEASFSARDGALKLPTATRYERRYAERDGLETLGLAWTTRGATGFAALMVGAGRGAET